MFAAVAATALTTLAALSPISRAISKHSQEFWLGLKDIFLNHSIVALAVGLAFVSAAILLAERHRLLAIALVILAPVAALVTSAL